MVYTRLESLFYLGPEAWNMSPFKYKETESLLEFKTKIKVRMRIVILAKFTKVATVILDMSRF